MTHTLSAIKSHLSVLSPPPDVQVLGCRGGQRLGVWNL